MTKKAADRTLLDDPLWYKDAVIYELHVRAFADSNGDGIGDFRGLAERLDYLRDLGVTAIWLLPFYPSPLKDDGYDIADYRGVHADYGSMADFKLFLREAHRRGLRVITELVLNHTSDQHPWFQRARRAPRGTIHRDFYVWSDDPEKFRGTRIIFKDFEASNWSWDPVAQSYYWHRFYHHQPDLNFDNPEVRRAVFREMDFWLKLGVDGLRLDAVPYLYEREGTNCENLPETHATLRELRRHVDSSFRNRMLLAEANQWPEDAVEYFGGGDECHMAFHFPVMPRMFMALRMEDRYPIVDILEQTPPIPAGCQWAVFLRNHDELTLEMVTDEERDYMYRVYANDPRARINLGIRRRLAPLLGNDRRRIELMNGLLFSLPGTPVLYYGDEIGMGDNIFLGDRNGVRTPMQWSGDRNAGFSRANAQRLFLPVIIDPEFHYEAINVEAQQNNPHSLLWWMRRLVALRKQYHAFGRGSLEILHPENRKVLAFVRRYERETVLVVANLSRYVQFVELDLSEFAGRSPIELFGGLSFPTAGSDPYLLTLGPHAFYWFAFEPSSTAIAVSETPEEAPSLAIAGGFEALVTREGSKRLAGPLPAHLPSQRWFGSKARSIKSVEILDALPIQPAPVPAAVFVVSVDYSEGEAEMYVLPLAFLGTDEVEQLDESVATAVVARLSTRTGDGWLVDAMTLPGVATALLETLARRRVLRGSGGDIVAVQGKQLRRVLGAEPGALTATPLRGEQSNTSILFEERLILKLFRRPEPGPNPDVEIGQYLTDRVPFANTPPLAGSLVYRPKRGEETTIAIVQGFVPNEGDAWHYTQDMLARYLDRAAATTDVDARVDVPGLGLLELARAELPGVVRESIGIYLESARALGERTAEMHLALATETDDPAFAPEPFSPFYLRQLYQAMRNRAEASLQTLRQRLMDLPDPLRGDARALLEMQRSLLARLRGVLSGPITGLRTRIHGDYHLGQVLHTGKDFVIIDFEGEPALALSARRIKRSPLRDVAGMLRSFHYAAFAALHERERAGMLREYDVLRIERWARLWVSWVSATFLGAYLAAAARGRFLPASDKAVQELLDAFLIEKAMYELSYELNHRPDWVRLPLRGILDLIDQR